MIADLGGSLTAAGFRVEVLMETIMKTLTVFASVVAVAFCFVFTSTAQDSDRHPAGGDSVLLSGSGALSASGCHPSGSHPSHSHPSDSHTNGSGPNDSHPDAISVVVPTGASAASPTAAPVASPTAVPAAAPAATP